MTDGPRIAIVGGGFLGLTLALRLRERGCAVTVLEGAAAPGGLASPQTIGGYTWDRFYHVIAPSDAVLLGLLEELGLGDRVHWNTSRTGFYGDGRLVSMSSTLEFLRFPLLGLVDKARLAATILYASRVRDWHALEEISAVEWLRRWSGRRTVERVWVPLLKAKLGDNYRQASAAFIWAIIARMYAARQSGMKREQFGWVDGGYDRVLERLRARLEAAGIALRTGTAVTGVRDTGAGAVVGCADGTRLRADAVVLTVPATGIPDLVPQLTPAERERLGRVVYQGVICASMLLREPLADYYVTNITDPGLPFTAVVEMTALVGRARFGGNALVYLPRYLTQDDPSWTRSDADIEAEFVAGLERMYPSFRPDQILATRVARARRVLAVSTLGYSRLACPPVRTSLPHVHIVNSAQIVSGTLNLNETITRAYEGAAALGGILALPAAAPGAAA